MKTFNIYWILFISISIFTFSSCTSTVLFFNNFENDRTTGTPSTSPHGAPADDRIEFLDDYHSPAEVWSLAPWSNPTLKSIYGNNSLAVYEPARDGSVNGSLNYVSTMKLIPSRSRLTTDRFYTISWANNVDFADADQQGHVFEIYFNSSSEGNSVVSLIIEDGLKFKVNGNELYQWRGEGESYLSTKIKIDRTENKFKFIYQPITTPASTAVSSEWMPLTNVDNFSTLDHILMRYSRPQDRNPGRYIIDLIQVVLDKK